VHSSKPAPKAVAPELKLAAEVLDLLELLVPAKAVALVSAWRRGCAPRV
jgi:hypothetical protein